MRSTRFWWERFSSARRVPRIANERARRASAWSSKASTAWLFCFSYTCLFLPLFPLRFSFPSPPSLSSFVISTNDNNNVYHLLQRNNVDVIHQTNFFSFRVWTHFAEQKKISSYTYKKENLDLFPSFKRHNNDITTGTVDVVVFFLVFSFVFSSPHFLLKYTSINKNDRYNSPFVTSFILFWRKNREIRMEITRMAVWWRVERPDYHGEVHLDSVVII